MRRKSFLVACCLLFVGLVGCNQVPWSQIPTGPETPGAVQPLPVEPTQTSTATEDALSAPSTGPAAPGDRTSEPVSASPTATVLCDSAAAGRPIDVTIPDDTIIPAGTSFTKTWRLVNTGSCPWTPDYAVVWFSGDRMGPIEVQNLPRRVETGQSIDITVDMTAPDEAGVRQSYWKLRNASSEFFGIGPAGNAPFWVRIIVEEIATPAPTQFVETITTPVTLVQGAVDLQDGERIDLDSGQKGEEGDLVLESDGNLFTLKPAAGALLGVAGNLKPSLADCRLVFQGSEGIAISELPPGTYFCYQTDQGLPGIARLADLGETGIRLDFITWAIP